MRRADIEGIHPLSPAQHGMLLESIHAGSQGLFIEQLVTRYESSFDQERYVRAWQQLIDRHEMLRTAFVWKKQKAPLQVVLRAVEVPAERLDWRDQADGAEEAVGRWLALDRERGVPLTRAPLLRLALIQLPDAVVAVVSFHHLLLDGWSVGVIGRELGALLRAPAGSEPVVLPPVRPYRDYVRWILGHDRAAIEAYWRAQLRPSEEPTALGRAHPLGASPGSGVGRVRELVSAPVTRGLSALAAESRITLSTVLHGAWALLLGCYAGSDAPLFGTTVSGRPAELPGVESIVGLFISTLPMRVELDPTSALHPWLLALQRHHLELQRNGACSLGEIHQWSGLPGATPLFESVLVVENQRDGAPSPATLSVGSHTRYPVVLMVSLGPRLELYLVHDRARLDDDQARRVLHHLQALLGRMSTAPARCLGELVDFVTEDEIPRVHPRPRSTSMDWSPPRTPTERVLADLWRELLGVTPGLEDDFLGFGGHSLLATQLLSRVRERLGVELTLADFFRAPTLAGLAESVQAQRPAPVEPIPRYPDAPSYPLSFGQARIWLLEKLQEGTLAFVIPMTFALPEGCSPEHAQLALNALVVRHASLRTTCPQREGGPVQVIAPAAPRPLTILDLRDMTPAQRQTRAHAAYMDITRAFDIEGEALFRTCLLREPEGDRLLLCVHHLIFDGWSMGVLMRDLRALCRAAIDGLPVALPELPIRYADFARWQRERLAGPRLQALLDYWVARLDGLTTLQLPTDHPRPRRSSDAGEGIGLALGPKLAEQVRTVGRARGATTFMVLLTGFGALLGRLAGQDDVAVGIPVAGRTQRETEGLIGFFLNSLVLRVSLAGDPTFLELLARVKETTLEAFAHQELPFERLLASLHTERDLSRSPLFQVYYNVLNYADEGDRLAEVESLSLDRPRPSKAKFDMTLYVEERGEDIQLQLVYRTELFAHPRMAELLRQLQQLLAQALSNPAARMGGHSLVTPRLRPLLPEITAPLDDAWGGSLPALVREQAEKTPAALAVVGGGARWSYRELVQRVEAVALQLRGAGARKGDVVALWAGRCPQLVPVVLGVIQAGAALLMLDPAHPAARHARVIRTAAPAVLLHLDQAGAIPAEVGRALPETCAVLMATTEPRALIGGWPELGPDDPCMLATTSGSSGIPKLIIGRHGPMTHYLPIVARRFSLGPDDRFSLLAGLSHDPLQREIFTPLVLGGTVCVPPAGLLQRPRELPAWIGEAGITVAHFTPSLARMCSHGDDPPAVPLRLAFFMGEPCTTRDIVALRRWARGARCVALYGATETQRVGAWHEVPAKCDAGAEPEPLVLGEAVPGSQLLLLTPFDQQAGVGELAEIVVRSPHLAAGYLGDAALSERAFRPTPGASNPADRLYYTGDLARRLPDGRLLYHGRADEQVKIRGMRVELGEVRSALLRHPSVDDAVLGLRPGSQGDPVLVAWILPTEGSRLAVDELRHFVTTSLPSNMVPSHFVPLSALPLTANGKLDRRALPEPARMASRPADETMSARQRQILTIWESVLERDGIGLDDDFFALGGHSLLAALLLARIQRSTGVGLPLTALFDAPTVRALVELIEGNADAREQPIRPAARDAWRVPLSDS